MHQLTDRRFVDALRRRHQRDSILAEGDEHQRVIDAVAVHPRQLVDDDVFDVALVLDALEHRLECWPLVHPSSAASRFDVLVDDVEAHLFCFSLTGSALCRDGETFRVVVGVDL